ncbi:MAG: hypothetical protein BGO29_13435 [Bacteroidales bacterium 36-12]|nr:MAG: hypothetical protein BGO29_13435 [Bacteroidales bacterium 36-12]
MKKIKNSLILPFIIFLGAFLVLTTSCEKADNIINNNSFKDQRDGNIYKIKRIGDQVWMAENLRYLPNVVGAETGSETTPYYYVYDYNGTNISAAKATSNYKTYGVLYNWSAAMSGATSSIGSPSEVQGVCPKGWHLPSKTELTELLDYLGRDAIGKLKEDGLAHWNSPNADATNETGFSALPGGYRNGLGKFDYIGEVGLWWTATQSNSNYAWLWFLHYSGNQSGVLGANAKSMGLCVRCIMD